MSLLSLPDPEQWSTGGRRLLRVTIAGTVFVALSVYFGTRHLLRGETPSALVLFGIGVTFALALSAVHLVARGRTTLRVSVDSTGTTLRADRVFCVLMTLALAMAIPVGGIVVIATLTGDLELFTSARDRIASVLMMGAATLVAARGLLSAWRRGGLGSVKLTPDGVEVADILRTTAVAWNDVVAVDDHSVSKKTRKAVVLRHSDGTETTIDGADFYVPNGAGLYWMVRHYRECAEERGELGDGRALQRLLDGRFEVE